MTQQVGRKFLIKNSDGAGSFKAFAGITGKSLKIGTERIDTTVPDPTTPEGILWRRSLDGAKSVSFQGDGKLVKDASEARLVEMAMSQAAEDEFEIVVPNVGTFTGVFSLEVDLGDDGAVTFAISAENNGPVSFVAEGA